MQKQNTPNSTLSPPLTTTPHTVNAEINGENPFAEIAPNCEISLSQEELLSLSKFAREEEFVSGEQNDVVLDKTESSKIADLGKEGMELDEGGDEFEVCCADCEAQRDERGEKGKDKVGVRVRVRPLVKCCGGEKVLIFEGGVKVRVVSPLRSVAPTPEEGGSGGEKEKLEEVIEVEEDEKEERGKSDGGEGERAEMRKKRELPKSFRGDCWGEGSEERMFGDQNKEFGGKNGDETMRCILEALRVISSRGENVGCGEEEIDIVESAKRRGMRFRTSRYLVDEMEEEC